VDALEKGCIVRLNKHARVAVAPEDNVCGRDIAYWYPVDLTEDGSEEDDVCHGDLVFITSQLTLTKYKPVGQAACVCGVVVSPTQPWVTVGQPLPNRTCHLVCIKGQVPVNVVPANACGRPSVRSPHPGDLLVPHPDVPGACVVLPYYASSDTVVAQVVSTSLPLPRLPTSGSRNDCAQQVLAHVHMPAVQVGPRYGFCPFLTDLLDA
jgi:hypothetical protein